MRLLDELYGTSLSPKRMRDRTSFLAVSLLGNPTPLERKIVKMKLFFESEAEEQYAEFYLIVDMQAQVVEFHEKDTGYRRAVVLSLSAHAGS